MKRVFTRARTASAAAALIFGIIATGGVSWSPSSGVVLGPQEAAAQVRGEVRRTARRTSRRTSRRQSYIHSLPGGCARRGAYYYCGGVYYQPQVRDGATVYIVVNP